MSERLSLADLGVTEDPGTDWHPRADKTEARDADGHLVDLGDNEVVDHMFKPEAAAQIDGSSENPLAAEDSRLTAEDAV